MHEEVHVPTHRHQEKGPRRRPIVRIIHCIQGGPEKRNGTFPTICGYNNWYHRIR